MKTDDHYQNTNDFFSSAARDKQGFYDSKSNSNLSHTIQQRLVRRLVLSCIKAALKIDNNISSIIDAGCGKGDVTNMISESFIQFKRLQGTDFSKDMIFLAKKETSSDKISFEVADVRTLPFADKEFDISLCMNVLHHIMPLDQNKALDELARLAKKYIILEIKNGDNFHYKYFHRGKLKNIHVYQTSVERVERVLNPLGFYLVEEKGIFIWSILSPLVVVMFKKTD